MSKTKKTERVKSTDAQKLKSLSRFSDLRKKIAGEKLVEGEKERKRHLEEQAKLMESM